MLVQLWIELLALGEAINTHGHGSPLPGRKDLYLCSVLLADGQKQLADMSFGAVCINPP